MTYATTTLNSGSGGRDVATDRVAAVDFQRVKIVHGPEGTTTAVDAGSGLPVSDAGGSLTVDNAGTFATQATQAGTWNVATVTTVTTVAAVTALGTVTPGTAATNLGKAVDSVAGSTDTGVAALAIRDDSLTTLAPVDGHYAPLRVNSQGALHTTGGVSYQFDAPAGATDSGIPGMFIRDDALSALTPVEGDYAPARVDSTGAIWCRLTNGIDGVADDGAFTVAGTFVMPAGFLADETSPDSVNEGDAGAGRMTLDRYIRVTTTPDGDVIKWGGVNCTVQYAAIAAASSGNNTIIAAVASKTIIVLGLSMVPNGNVNVKFQSGAGGTDLTGLYYLAANSGVVLPQTPSGHFKCLATNTLLNMNLSGAVAVGGVIQYITV